MSSTEQSYNPDFDPTGFEGGLDTNKLPWIRVPTVEGMSIKPLRASSESGFYSVVVKLEAGSQFPGSVYLGGADMLVLSGSMTYTVANETTKLSPGIWGYVPANVRTAALVIHEESELLMNFYSAVAFLDESGKVSSMLTSMDIKQLANNVKLDLVPGTLAGCMQSRPDAFSGEGEPLAISKQGSSALVGAAIDGSSLEISSPHFVDTRSVPWLVIPAMPDVGLKILRVSEETGNMSVIVKHNGIADPHVHLGASDFLVLQGRIGYRAGPPEGYGPGVWFYEAPGARHDATQRLSDEDLIYTANIYGPLIFDDGPDTPVTAVLSWIEYKALAAAGEVKLVPSEASDDTTLLAWAPL